MIRPPMGCWSFMILKASWVHRNEPVRIVSTTAFQRSKANSSIGADAPKPALLNSTSRRPKVSLARANSARTESGLPTSVGTPSAFPCRPSISPTTACSGSGRRPATTTANPSLARAIAEALPIPLPPPVTRATFPFELMPIVSFCVGRERYQFGSRCKGEIAYVSWDDAAHRPGGRRQGARAVGGAGEIGRPNPLLDEPAPFGGQAFDIGPHWPLPAEEWLPVIGEIGIFHADRDRAALDRGEPGLAPQRRQAVGQGKPAGEQAIAGGPGRRVETGGSVPDQALIDEPAAKIPYR